MVRSYGSMVAHKPSNTPAGVRPRHKPIAPIAQRTQEPPQVGRTVRFVLISKNSAMCWCSAARGRRGPTPSELPFADLGPDAGAARWYDRCETHARTHSAPRSGAAIQNLKNSQRTRRRAPALGRRPHVSAVTWLILPVVICLSQRLSHACLSISIVQRNCRRLIKTVMVYLMVHCYLDNRSNSRANTCTKERLTKLCIY